MIGINTANSVNLLVVVIVQSLPCPAGPYFSVFKKEGQPGCSGTLSLQDPHLQHSSPEHSVPGGGTSRAEATAAFLLSGVCCISGCI